MHKLKAHEENIKDVKIAKYLGDTLNTEGTIDELLQIQETKVLARIAKYP